MKDTIFVFGSNLAGRHGAGSAKHAYLYYGAKYGVGIGRTGNSYAIPTKDKNLKVLSLSEINKYVQEFVKYAIANPDLKFEVVKIGCGLAGYSENEISPMFQNTPENVRLPEGWKKSWEIS